MSAEEPKPCQLAMKHARTYLRFQLGDRRGCRVLEIDDKEAVAEIITECAIAMEHFANKWNRRAPQPEPARFSVKCQCPTCKPEPASVETATPETDYITGVGHHSPIIDKARKLEQQRDAALARVKELEEQVRYL